ncbi:kinase-like domain-containing protein, partial [Dimargaris cristalligena]
MDPFARRRSAFPTPSVNPSASTHLKRSTTAASKDPTSAPTIYGYRLTKSLGRGTFSKVYLGVNKATDEHVALKFIKNRPGSKSDKHEIRVQREINILTLIQHPNIISIKKRADTTNNTILVMEYAQGGELLSYIRQHGRLQEQEARVFFRQIVSAIDYCHKNCVLHRDLKLENVMLDARKSIKIIDFGFANTFRYDSLLDTFCGSPFYAAPEMVNGVKYVGPEVDIWSMGVILFFMLCGRTPFEGENLREIYQKISQGHYTIPPNTSISNSAADLIRRMLNTAKESRIKMHDIRHHPWVM